RLDTGSGSREGVLHLAGPKLDVFFVTIQKTEATFSPTTMYKDYAISDRPFHWQSQSTTSVSSPTGQRYLHHAQLGYLPLLLIRPQGAAQHDLPRRPLDLGGRREVTAQEARPAWPHLVRDLLPEPP